MGNIQEEDYLKDMITGIVKEGIYDDTLNVSKQGAVNVDISIVQQIISELYKVYGYLEGMKKDMGNNPEYADRFNRLKKVIKSLKKI